MTIRSGLLPALKPMQPVWQQTGSEKEYDMKYVISLMFSLILTGCGAGSGEGLNSNGQPVANEPDPSPPPQNPVVSPTLAVLQERVFTPICSQCHAGSNAPVGLRLDSAQASMANLIDITSSNPQFKRVKVGDAANSYLYMKITGNPVAGNRMPLGQAPLSEEVISLFRDWINAGAQISADAPVVSQTLVRNVEGTTQGVLLTFSQPMQTGSLSASQVELTALQVGTELPGVSLPEVSVAVQSQWQDKNKLYIELPKNDLKKARITINNPALSTVLSEQGIELDGDRNGTPGGMYRHEILL